MAITLTWIYPRGSLQTLATIGLGAVIYFTTLLLIDKDARQLVRKAAEEAKKLIIAQTE
ncbi:MAG: hypothetical protein QXH35_06315 [Nitrososphaerota archaeon]